MLIHTNSGRDSNRYPGNPEENPNPDIRDSSELSISGLAIEILSFESGIWDENFRFRDSEIMPQN